MKRIKGGRLIASPEYAGGLDACGAGAAEGHTGTGVFLCKVVIRFDIGIRILIAHFQAIASVVEGGVAAPDHFAAIGLEAINSNIIEQVSTLRHPPVHRVRIGEVQKQAIAEPPGGWDTVLASLAVSDGVALLNHVCLVIVLLLPGIIGVFEHRNLPQQHLHPIVMDGIHHGGGIRPFLAIGKVTAGKRLSARPCRIGAVIEDIEGVFVAPLFQDHYRGRNVIGLCVFYGRKHLGLSIPLIGGHPKPKCPFGHILGLPTKLGIAANHLFRRSADNIIIQHRIITRGIHGKGILVRIAVCHIELSVIGGIKIQAVSLAGIEKRYGQIASFALILVLVINVNIHRFSTLFNSVITLPKSVKLFTGRRFIPVTEIFHEASAIRQPG